MIHLQGIPDLHDRRASIDFYQERYAHGYMDEWPAEKKQRIFQIIRSIEVPDYGESIDFGCGNGVFTDVVRQALPPKWRVYGVDISSTAVRNAARRYPECTFFVSGARELTGRRFDFLFTHHVLEHVFNLGQVLTEIDEILKENATVVHVLPCGNEGSFEHQICRLRSDGIDLRRENRFFFEDEGHVRRLTSNQLIELYEKKEFVLAKEYYSNQYYGAIDWITQSGPGFVLSFVDIEPAVYQEARERLRKIRRKLLLLWALRYPASMVDGRLRRRTRSLRDYCLLALGLPLYLFAKPTDLYLKRKARNEWEGRKTDRNGSEMYLCFKR
ncbi:MAG TPA: class I SAM-dependent methyltransferase [Acidobacteriota bacterium]|nr:class I SAM-dependent methyltransferase [Acidobacteriota bacterium]